MTWGSPRKLLALRPGRYIVTIRDRHRRIINRYTITIREDRTTFPPGSRRPRAHSSPQARYRRRMLLQRRATHLTWGWALLGVSMAGLAYSSAIAIDSAVRLEQGGWRRKDIWLPAKQRYYAGLAGLSASGLVLTISFALLATGYAIPPKRRGLPCTASPPSHPSFVQSKGNVLFKME